MSVLLIKESSEARAVDLFESFDALRWRLSLLTAADIDCIILSKCALLSFFCRFWRLLVCEISSESDILEMRRGGSTMELHGIRNYGILLVSVI